MKTIGFGHFYHFLSIDLVPKNRTPGPQDPLKIDVRFTTYPYIWTKIFFSYIKSSLRIFSGTDRFCNFWWLYPFGNYVIRPDRHDIKTFSVLNYYRSAPINVSIWLCSYYQLLLLVTSSRFNTSERVFSRQITSWYYFKLRILPTYYLLYNLEYRYIKYIGTEVESELSDLVCRNCRQQYWGRREVDRKRATSNFKSNPK